MTHQSTEAAYDLSDSTALITGAAGDIGGAVAERLARSGARVALADIRARAEELERSAERCGAHTAVATVVFDVTDEDSVESAFATIADRFDVPDLIFNNAGVQGAIVEAADYPIDDARRVLDVNVMGVINVLREGARRLRQTGRPGAIVNTASMAGVSGAPNMLAYSASKGAVISLTKAAARDLAPLGIRVNSVSPAFIGPGAMWTRQVERQAAAGSQYFSDNAEQVAAEMVAQIPMRRIGSTAEVASVVVWLLSAESSYVTGENVTITGGIV